MTDPTTPAEWQEAVDAAAGALALRDARLYGLVTGGPLVNVGRCEEILEHGRELGYRPAPKAIEEFAQGLVR